MLLGNKMMSKLQACMSIQFTQELCTCKEVSTGFMTLSAASSWKLLWHCICSTPSNSFRSTDALNPVFMMAFSGARGNISQTQCDTQQVHVPHPTAVAQVLRQ
jgi:hypothetical protein